MADFKTHITTSTALGIAYGVGGRFIFDLPIDSCVLAGGLCSIGGMLPDLDSDSGIPVRETLAVVSMLVPMLFIQRMAHWELTSEQLVLVGATLYFLVRFGVGSLFRRFTVHRGMWHSIPAAVIAGLATFHLCDCEVQVRMYKAWAIVIGYFSHLILDELYAVDLNGRQIKIKKSFGSALKLFGSKSVPNLMTFGCLIVIGTLVWFDPAFQQVLRQRGVEIPEMAHKHDQAPFDLLKAFRR
jgi:hypothetical protein